MLSWVLVMNCASIPALINQMLKPDFYPHPVSKNIQLIQTHISYILLTGDYAYKIKKPVNFGFLDFSTLEKREHFCQEELRLNFIGAAQLYLEVLPITQDGEQYHLGGTKKPVEYVLKMHQFPQEGLLSTMLERGKLSESDVEELGKVVARYHNQTETSVYIRSFGEVDKVRRSIDENYDILITFLLNIHSCFFIASKINAFVSVMEIYTCEISVCGIRKFYCLTVLNLTKNSDLLMLCTISLLQSWIWKLVKEKI